ncbi:hypothetical protein ACOCG7_23490 [Paraburkholderia sp. DD10]|uniref:hypothetical protein n=1 Tax=Paraburkholderia sp. DD10 TaxID=3409691 RepID=UPI003B9E1179
MPTIEYRPWGILPALLPKIGPLNWSLLGAISTEDRCLAAWEFLRDSGSLGYCRMLQIDDDKSAYQAEVAAKTAAMSERFVREGGSLDSRIQLSLFARFGDVVEIAQDFAANGGDNLIVDISSLPKRFFFAFIRFLRERCTAPNIVVTCSMPSRYATDGKPLAEDPEPWRHLPGFMQADPEPENPLVIIGIGYESLGLTTIFESGGFRNSDIKMLLPFPSQPSGVERNWEFVRELSAYVNNTASTVERVDARDVSETFQYIRRLANHGERYAVLAPFGPKSLSLAMCLYATAPATRPHSTVFYTQPRAYHPAYSSGVAQVGQYPEIYAYCVRLAGRDLYE